MAGFFHVNRAEMELAPKPYARDTTAMRKGWLYYYCYVRWTVKYRLPRAIGAFRAEWRKGA